MSRKWISFLINQIDGSYQSTIWKAAAEKAEKNGTGLIIITGGCLDSPIGIESEYNTIYPLVPELETDGLIILSGSLSHFLSEEKFKGFLEPFRSVPQVSISDYPGKGPVINIDNAPGFRELLSHLTDHHGYRNIAFIQGPESSRDAGERYRVYLEHLSSRNIPFRETLVFKGNFRPEKGAEAIRDIIRKKIQADVLVFANDDMAFGALLELSAMGIPVPDHFRLTGFDDIPEMSKIRPGITTVRQPLIEIGKTAVSLVCSLINGGPVPSETVLPTKLAVRRSCGCAESPDRGPSFIKIPREYPMETMIRYYRHFTVLGQNAASEKQIYLALEDYALAYGLPSFSLYLFEEVYTAGHWSEFRFPERFRRSFRFNARLKKTETNLSFDGYIPPRQLKNDLDLMGPVHILSPLVIQNNLFGFLVFHGKLTETDPILFDTLRDGISGALNTVRIMKQLQHSEQRYREMAFKLPAILIETDNRGRISYMNESAQALLLENKSFRGKQPLDIRFLFSDGAERPVADLLDKVKTTDNDQFATFPYKDSTWLLKGEIRIADDEKKENTIKWLGLDLNPFLKTFSQPVEDFYIQYHFKKRERQILELIIQGYQAKEIADELFLALSTVKNYISDIYTALDIGSRRELFELIKDYQINRLGQESYLFSVLNSILKHPEK